MAKYIRETAATEVKSALTTGKKIAKGNKAKAKPATKVKASKASKAAKRAPRGDGTQRKAGEGLGYRVANESKIKVVAKTSPYRDGTVAGNTWALLAKGGTVEAFRAACAKNPEKFDAGYVRYAARDGFISLS